MGEFKVTDTSGDIVARRPALSSFFEEAGIDYCCDGKRSLADACRKKGIDATALLAELEAAAARDPEGPVVDALSMPLAELADHIERTHHAYLHAELPRLTGLTRKVATVHGEKDPRLQEVRSTFLAMAEELSSHMMKEEHILLPWIRQLEGDGGPQEFPCASLAQVIRQMESEHEEAGLALARLRELTDGHAPPDWACNSYRALLDALARLERDMHRHVHTENNVLFPRAIQLEEGKSA